MKKWITGFIFFLSFAAIGQEVLKKFAPLVEQGQFTQAQQAMRQELAENPTMPVYDRLALEFEIERLDRIRKDFNKSEEEVLSYIRRYIPEVTTEDLRRWEREKSLESLVIDGQRWYFARAASNLFRIDQEAKKRKAEYEQKHGKKSTPVYVYEEDARQIIVASEALRTSLVKPRRMRITYKLTVAADAVPPGEVIRAWLPYPREGNRRQVDIKLLYCQPNHYLIADNDRYLQRTIYMEQIAKAGEPTVFVYSFSYKSYAEYLAIDPQKIQPYDTTSILYKTYTREQPPHIVFTPELRKVSQEIIGNESNPFLKAKRIFEWVDRWVPWAGAREYSTVPNLSMYAYENKHGDCGMQTMLFMTLARMNGIPVHWQSGYEMMPGEESMHDWCEMYLEPYGWVLVDQSYGLKSSKDERVKWFCLGNTDAYRWIVNDDFSQPLFPAKIFPRSETVDFQRGEVEWRGGNLYFDQWDYDWQVEMLD